MAVRSVVKISELEGAKRLDAEYYRPIYKKWAEEIQKVGYEELSRIATVAYGTTPHGGVFEDQGIPFVRSQAFSLLCVDSTALLYCSDDFHSENRKSEICPGDILVAAVGATIGEIAIVPADMPRGNVNQNIARVRIRSRDFLPQYIAVFLATRLGQFQIDRLATGNAQPYLNSAQIRSLRIPRVPLSKQRIAEQTLEQVRDELKQSESTYLQAERMVLEDIGWHELALSQPKWWTAPLSRGREIHRLDAEHFQPKYDKHTAYLKKTGKAKPLGEIGAYVRRGLQPEYVENGEVIVVNSQHLGRYLLNVEATERTDRQFWEDNKRARLRKNDVLLYSTGAYVGRTNTWLEDAKGIGSNHVTIIRRIGTCNPLYLSVFLNSTPGILQAERWASGSGQREVYPDDIARFLIYLPSERFQEKVAGLVQQSYEARQKAKSLLEEAKQKVEAIIEGRTR